MTVVHWLHKTVVCKVQDSVQLTAVARCWEKEISHKYILFMKKSVPSA